MSYSLIDHAYGPPWLRDVTPGSRIAIDGIEVIVVSIEPVREDGVTTSFSVTTRPVTDAD